MNNKKNKNETEDKDLFADIEVPKAYSAIDGRFLHVKVGNHDKPATNEDIETIEAKLNELFEENNIKCTVFVSHHAVNISLY